jgi:hypothetical protein
MIYRVAILNTILLATIGSIQAYAEGNKSSVFKGTCSTGSIAESDGVQTGAASGRMNSKDYFALMKRAKATHMKLGPDGFLWSTEPLHCDSIAIVQMDDYQGHTLVRFSNGDANNPILGFAGGRVSGDGPLFFSETVYLADGKAIPLSSGGGQGCHFYFADHGTFTQGWEKRLYAIECDVRMKGPDGHLLTADVKFDVAQPPPPVRPSRDPATDVP